MTEQVCCEWCYECGDDACEECLQCKACHAEVCGSGSGSCEPVCCPYCCERCKTAWRRGILDRVARLPALAKLEAMLAELAAKRAAKLAKP